MPDYGHDLLFGTFLTPSAADPQRILALAQLTEDAGLDLVTVQDHPYQPAFLDTWTLLAAIATRTNAVRVAPNVANLPLRLPAVLAKSVASLDLISGGRVELGLGAGAFGEAAVAMGAPKRTPGQSVTALDEALQIIRAFWRPDGGPARVDGEYYRVWGAKPGPAPAHEPGIWLGSYKARMLRLTGAHADGWLPSSFYAAPETLAEMNKIIDDAASEAGRDPAQVRRLYNIGGTFMGPGAEFLQGPPGVWAEQLAELAVVDGMSAFILASDDADTIRQFAAEVVPAVRELVQQERVRHERRHAPDDQAPDDQAIGAAESSGEPDTSSRAGAGPGRDAGRGSVAPALGVTPTPDDGTRLSQERPWSEDDRPVGPEPEAGRTYTAHEQASGQHLVDVHDHLRSELQRLRELVDQVEAGSMDAGTARSQLNTMTMRQNNWTLGTFCESYCRVVTHHHMLEDQAVFPRLRHGDARLAPVLDRLQEEHVVIHGIVERVDRALVGLVRGDHGIEEVRSVVDLLTDTLLSHLSYEERELVEPLARLGFW
ncbi:LLM class flavin-dependent oxidoreductase [Actinobacteria bacterium YIM 96077]|uniref:5,10-methylene tetrahydromethanopterin reductase n=1 Tax=Phytoactinopolyspora halophila TaxID=1981511 RepID=A0A329QND3_9ACTN|nr:LLM class flavin-dependent oxidoreductase [Phytoactinopolyspora halophila]AYY12329.1 LLM class flavin-dependent oxidoreductase [Actinobacteria bacterium YIM 96077]RAW13753.1 5,10-methylene tetrahydromethanopterin reductase [Phytoactinopolyspora halophila]